MVCRICKCDKPLSEFYEGKLKNSDYRCKECVKSDARKRRKNLTPEQKKLQNHKKNAWRRGITLEEYFVEYENIQQAKSLGMKYCYGCCEIKSLEEFNKLGIAKDGLMTKCKECMKKVSINYYVDNLEKVSKRKSNDYKNNREKKLAYHRNYIKKKILENPVEGFKLKCRQRVYASLKKRLKNKTGRILDSHIKDILGCDIAFFVNYIENQFSEGMTWENWNHRTWHLDHIVPLKEAKTEEEVIKLCHYTNFQPLWAIDNMKKNRKYKR